MGKHLQPPCSDEAVKAKTGRGWSEWCKLLDAKGAVQLEHKKIAELVDSMHSAGSWWSQTIAGGYERLRGKRSLHERNDGSYSMSISKTFPVSADKVHSFFVNEQKRGLWLRDEIKIRTATAPKSVRITWPDKTSVAVWITAKSEDKCSVAMEHSKLKSQTAVTAQKQFWKAALERLANVVV